MIMNPMFLGVTSWWRTGWPIEFSIFDFSDCDKNALPLRLVQEKRREKGVSTEKPLSSKSGDKEEAASSSGRTAWKVSTAKTSQKSGETEGQDGKTRGLTWLWGMAQRCSLERSCL